jgi:hypothetical protein
MKYQKGLSLNFFYQKRPSRVAARLAMRRVARASRANDGKKVPLTPKPACHLPDDAVNSR